MAKRTDPLVHTRGSIFLLHPTSRRGCRWVDDHITDKHGEWAGAVVVEHRHVSDIVDAAVAAGLRVK